VSVNLLQRHIEHHTGRPNPPQRGANGAVLATGLAAYRCGQLSSPPRAASARSTRSQSPWPAAAEQLRQCENAAGNALQLAINAAAPGDLVIVGPGTYRENVLMWKPVRLQGVGAGATTINADAHPAGKLDAWRRQVVCLFGLALNGVPLSPTNPDFDPTGTYSCPASQYLRVDRIPFEAIVGWDATGQRQPGGAAARADADGRLRRCGVTVLSRGIRIPNNSTDFWGLQGGAVAGAFPDGSVYLTNSTPDCTVSTAAGRDYGTSNFKCNPSRIDGLSISNSSQGGGGIFLHGWNHNLEVANTRVFGNHGTPDGGNQCRQRRDNRTCT